MSEHPDYTRFRREMFANMGLPINSHHTHDWRDVPITPHYWWNVCIMQSPEEIRQIAGIMEHPLEETLFTVPNWTWCPKWLWRFVPSHQELWWHKHRDVLAEERAMKELQQEQYDLARDEYDRQIAEMRKLAQEQRDRAYDEYERRKSRSEAFWDSI